MREKRITAVILSVFMVLSLLPSTVFAAASSAALEGQLKISGTAAVGSTLKADLKEVKPQGLSEDSISYLWSRKTDGDEEMKELSKEKATQWLRRIWVLRSFLRSPDWKTKGSQDL